MTSTAQLVVFTLDRQRFALLLASVERVVRAVEITSLPKAPEIVVGVINVRGQIIPIFNIRKRFRLPETEIKLNDQIIIAHTSKRIVGIIVDSVHDIIECPEQDIISAEKILPGIEYVEAVVKLKNGLLLIHDIDRFLSIEEAKMLEDAVKGLQ
ncbi:MAG: purine-binding chemotaxis protein CheW [Deltaproteobacteria bacterium]|nr:purine-binding chemotaxis protein CheW [Deltaproteobacteria bacterium]